MEPRISLIVNTFNEEEYIGNCLRSARKLCDELVVIDMGSTDNTVEVARQCGAKVITRTQELVVETARQFGVDQAEGEWILLLDPDEMVPASLTSTLRDMARSDRADVVFIPRANYALGRRLRASGRGLDQDILPRFFRRGAIQFSPRVHSVPAPRKGARVLRLAPQAEYAILHFAWFDTAQWLDKANRYTTAEVREAYRGGERPRLPLWRVFTAGIRGFFVGFVRYRGFLDGPAGTVLSLQLAIYVALERLKLWELQNGFSAEEARRRYQRVADATLAAYRPSKTH